MRSRMDDTGIASCWIQSSWNWPHPPGI